MHFFRNLKNKFKEPMNKRDLKRFLIEGFLGATIIGAFMGAVDFFISTTNLRFLMLFTFIIFYTILTNRLYKSFSFYHIWFSVLAIIFVLMGDYMKMVFGNLFAFYSRFKMIPLEIFNPKIYYSFLWYYPADALVIISNIISILVYVFICFMAFIRMKR